MNQRLNQLEMHKTSVNHAWSRWLLIFSVVITTSLSASASELIQLRSNIWLPSDQVEVTLKDVAWLRGDLAKAQADRVVATRSGIQDKTHLSLSQLRTKLRDEGVNLATFSLSGHAKCVIHWDLRTQADEQANPQASVGKLIEETLSEPDQSAWVYLKYSFVMGHDKTKPVRLKDVLFDWMSAWCEASPEDIRMSVRQRIATRLRDLPGQGRWEIQVTNSQKIGSLNVVMNRFETRGSIDTPNQVGRKAETLRFQVQIDVRRDVLVASEDLSKGDAITRQNVMLTSRYISEDIETTAVLDAILGQTLQDDLTAGGIVDASILVKPELVKRGDAITIQCMVGGVMLRMQARALESGAVGEFIRVRNEHSKKVIDARVIDTGVVTVELNP